ncbi:putative leader peptide [Streptomyces sp. NBC_01006]|uniref:putative leader peptide n=1 Tax=Streptomyces sp. NBC_01006 TaxID=2903716 RepID=UPI00386911EB
MQARGRSVGSRPDPLSGGAWSRGVLPPVLSVAGPLHPAISYAISREVLTRARRAPHDVPMSPSQPLLVRRRHVDLRRVASAVCRPV